MQRPPWFLRSRRRLLITYFGVQALALFPLTIAYAAFFIDHIPSGLALALPFLFTASLLLLQALFLLPVRRPTLAAEGKSIIATLVIGGFMIAILTVALALSAYGIVDAYAESLEIDAEGDVWLLAVLALTAWCLSSILLIMFCRRGTAEHVVQRIASGLFVGTIIEAAALIPLDLLYRRREGVLVRHTHALRPLPLPDRRHLRLRPAHLPSAPRPPSQTPQPPPL
jgi:hypothetical protein